MMPKAAFDGSRMECSQIDEDNNGATYTHIPQPLEASAKKVFINGKKAALKGDTSKCAPAWPVNPSIATIESGSSSVIIEGKPAARVGDESDHDQGKIISGSTNVFMG